MRRVDGCAVFTRIRCAKSAKSAKSHAVIHYSFQRSLIKRGRHNGVAAYGAGACVAVAVGAVVAVAAAFVDPPPL